MAVLKVLENCISKEKFIEKMKQFGWNVNWTEKRKHITFQNQDGKKVRDSNLSKTFHLDISKEGLENEFNGNREKSRVAFDRDSRADEELVGVSGAPHRALVVERRLQRELHARLELILMLRANLDDIARKLVTHDGRMLGNIGMHTLVLGTKDGALVGGHADAVGYDLD